MKAVASTAEAGSRVREVGMTKVQEGKKLVSRCLKKVGNRSIWPSTLAYQQPAVLHVGE